MSKLNSRRIEQSREWRVVIARDAETGKMRWTAYRGGHIAGTGEQEQACEALVDAAEWCLEEAHRQRLKDRRAGAGRAVVRVQWSAKKWSAN